VHDLDAALALRPNDNYRGLYTAAKLLQRMQALGISKYHPDPMGAIEQRTS
jgi:hypothetical protein